MVLQKMSQDGVVSVGLQLVLSFMKLVSLCNDTDALNRHMQLVM
jgi:hypothetical protein